MAAIPIGDAEPRIRSRLVEVLASTLFTDRLDEIAQNKPFDLPHPETWIEAQLNVTRHWRALNISEVMGVIHLPDESTTTAPSTGDGTQHSAISQSPVDVGIVMKAPDGFEAMETQGRKMIDDEVLNRQVGQYRRALLDIVPRHAPEPQTIHEIFIERRATSIFEPPEMGRFAHATVTFRVEQDVLINE